MDINKIIAIVRNLQEDAMGGGPTMSTASTAGKAGFGGSAQGFDPGPTAGKDLPIGKLDGRTKIARRLPPPYKKSLINSKKKK